ncbi:HAD family hydrolase [Arthrobacter psychrolactophilus]
MTLTVVKPAAFLVALDVDGTLMDDAGAISAEVKSAVALAVAAGHLVTIASGRSLGAVLPVLAELGLSRGYAVCSNGGLTVRLDPELPGGFEIIDRVSFVPRTALLSLQKNIPGVCFAVEDANGDYLSTTPFQDPSFGREARTVDLADILDREVVRVVASSAQTSSEEFIAAVAAAELQDVAYFIGLGGWLDLAGIGVVEAREKGLLRAQADMAAPNVSKASGLETLRASLGVEHQQTVAVGDGLNDLEMLRWAARGVAMGQAEDEVKAVADEVTETVARDGVAVCPAQPALTREVHRINNRSMWRFKVYLIH